MPGSVACFRLRGRGQPGHKALYGVEFRIGQQFPEMPLHPVEVGVGRLAQQGESFAGEDRVDVQEDLARSEELVESARELNRSSQ